MANEVQGDPAYSHHEPVQADAGRHVRNASPGRRSRECRARVPASSCGIPGNSRLGAPCKRSFRIHPCNRGRFAQLEDFTERVGRSGPLDAEGLEETATRRWTGVVDRRGNRVDAPPHSRYALACSGSRGIGERGSLGGSTLDNVPPLAVMVEMLKEDKK